jgi:hypothetical protein
MKQCLLVIDCLVSEKLAVSIFVVAKEEWTVRKVDIPSFSEPWANYYQLTRLYISEDVYAIIL